MSDETAECLWCGAPAVAWCDTEIGWVPSPEHGMREYETERFTCDAPMCGEHRRPLGHIGPETIDVCPAHRDVGLSVGVAQAVKHRQAARAVRSAIEVAARRSRMRLVP